MKQFLLIGSVGFHNFGCEAIYRGTRKILEHTFGPCLLHKFYPVKRKVPFHMARMLCPSRVGPMLYGGIADLIQQVDAVLLVGGDNFSLDYTPGPTWLTKGPITHTSLCDYMRQFKTPLVVWGASISNMPRHILKHLEGVPIFAREPLSIGQLRRKGLKERSYLVADPAFVMEDKPMDIRLPRFALGLNFSPLIGQYVPAWKSVIRQTLNRLLTTFPDYELVLIPHVVGGRKSDDALFMSRVLSRDIINHRRVHLVSVSDAQQAKYVIGQMQCMVACRMHAAIAGMSMGVPTLCIAYSQKGLGVTSMVYNRDELCLPTNYVTPSRIIDRVRMMLQQRNRIRLYLHGQMPHLRQLAYRAGEYLSEIIR